MREAGSTGRRAAVAASNIALFAWFTSASMQSKARSNIALCARFSASSNRSLASDKKGDAVVALYLE